MTVVIPVAEGVNVLVHVAVAPVPDSVQLVGLNVPAAPVLVKATVPVGVVGVAKVSVTVAVHVDPCAMKTGEVHATAVVVGCRVPTLSENAPLLVAWVVSPP